MSRTKGLAIAMYLGAALAGAAIALAADRITPSASRAPSNDPRERRTRFFDQLHLSAAQRDSATIIFDDRDTRIHAVWEQHKAVLDPIRAEQDSIDAEWRQRLTRLLTPEQKAIYDQMQQARRERTSSGRGGRGNDH